MLTNSINNIVAHLILFLLHALLNTNTITKCQSSTRGRQELHNNKTNVTMTNVFKPSHCENERQ